MNNYYVYEWIRLDTNEPFYVGKGKGNRWKDLKNSRNKWFKHIINKTSVAVNILHDNLDEETANGLEVWYIREYRDIIGYDLCNIQDGGEGHGLCGENNPMYGKHIRKEDHSWYGKHHTEETKEKISKSLKGKKRSKESCEKQFNSIKGNNNHNYGKHLSKETKKKISESKKGKYCGENAYWFGKHLSEETKLKLSESHKGKRCGEDNHNYGKPVPEETKKKISESKKGKGCGEDNPNAKTVICITTGRIFTTIKEGAEYYSCNISSISMCLKGDRKSAGKLENGTKLVWKYLTITPL